MVPSKIYVAGKYYAKPRLREEAAKLRAAGHTVTSRWLDHNLVESEVSAKGLRTEALNDIDDIRDSNVFVIDTFDVSDTGGREVEFGFAMNEGMAVYVVGPNRNIFHALADESFATWDEFHRFI